MVYITTLSGPLYDGQDTFIRANATLNGATTEAIRDIEMAFEELEMTNGDKEIDIIEGDGVFEPIIVRIINKHNGHEYVAYSIRPYDLGE